MAGSFSHKGSYFRLLNPKGFLLVVTTFLIGVGCKEIPKNDIKNIAFWYQTYVKESADGALEPFDRESYKEVDNLDLTFLEEPSGRNYTLEIIVINQKLLYSEMMIN